VACEVGEGGAAVAGEGTDEAVELNDVSLYDTYKEEIMGTYSARRDVVKLSGANRGKSNDGSDGEGLHFGGYSDVDTVIDVVKVLWYMYNDSEACRNTKMRLPQALYIKRISRPPMSRQETS
jgi:hypothetical protein